MHHTLFYSCMLKILKICFTFHLIALYLSGAFFPLHTLLASGVWRFWYTECYVAFLTPSSLPFLLLVPTGFFQPWRSLSISGAKARLFRACSYSFYDSCLSVVRFCSAFSNSLRWDPPC